MSVCVSVGEATLFGFYKTVNNEEFKHTSPAGVLPEKVCRSSILGEDVMQLEGLAACSSSVWGERSPRTMAWFNPVNKWQMHLSVRRRCCQMQRPPHSQIRRIPRCLKYISSPQKR